MADLREQIRAVLWPAGDMEHAWSPDTLGAIAELVGYPEKEHPVNERKLNNYTVLYGTYHGVMGTPSVECIHVKASSLHDARTMIPEGRFIAVFEGHITGLLG